MDERRRLGRPRGKKKARYFPDKAPGPVRSKAILGTDSSAVGAAVAGAFSSRTAWRGEDVTDPRVLKGKATPPSIDNASAGLG